MLKVQQYLQFKSLADLKEELGIEYSVYEDLVILNYSQIDSPKSHPIVMECRGLILQQDTWEVVCFPFKRFFNCDEVQEINEDFNFSNAIGLEKIDGTLISLFYYKDKWLMSTRGKIENSEKLSFYNLTFRTLFHETVSQYLKFWNNLHEDYTYVFELVSPENRVVTVYEKRELYLLTVRNKKTLCELPLETLQNIANNLEVKLPQIVDFKTKTELLDLAKSLKVLQEGFVAVDYSVKDIDDTMSYRRVKVKNPAYVAIHHLKDSAGKSSRSIVRLVINNEYEEFLSYFNEFRNFVEDVKIKYETYLKQAQDDEKSIEHLFALDFKNKEDKKQFALAVKVKKESAYFFAKFYRKTKNMEEYYKNIEVEKGSKYIEKMWVDKLKLNDIKLEVEE
jgi:T4 RnlA family RNA ligase